jgi:hypothetical protein
MGSGMTGEHERIDWLVFAVALFFLAASGFCVIASAFGFHPAITLPCTAVSASGLVAAVVWARLRGDDQ